MKITLTRGEIATLDRALRMYAAKYQELVGKERDLGQKENLRGYVAAADRLGAKLRPELQADRRITDSLLLEAAATLEEVRAQRDRRGACLARIANSVHVVLGSKALPRKVRAGLEAIAAEAREGCR